MQIKKIIINNFKCYSEKFKIEFKEGLNILVGDNEVGKSTILDAIQLVLSGIFEGKYFQLEANEFIINLNAKKNYIENILKKEYIEPPKIFIELYLDSESFPESKGSMNSEREDSCGVRFVFELDDNLKDAYKEFIETEEIQSVPIEYYRFYWATFSGMNTTPRNIPIRSAMIDSSSHKNSSGSDVHVNRIITDFLDNKEKIKLTQAHRRMKDGFMKEGIVASVNEKICKSSSISDKTVELSIDVSGKNRWEKSMTTFLDEIPFHYIGKGEQCLIKTKLALEHKKTTEANVILIEEPENHLSHSKLNRLINHIVKSQNDKQIIVSTHSSFVANKMGLNNLILLKNNQYFPFSNLNTGTNKFFKKLPGYNTLRLILCKKAILVEGDSDELIVQRAYFDKHGVLPIENEVDVISVGLSFLRFLEIAEKLDVNVSVISDSDGDIEAIEKKYENYLGVNAKRNIKICIDMEIDTGELMIKDKPFNYNTLEPKLLKANSLELFNQVLGKDFTSTDELHLFMKNNKTECALTFFDSETLISYPEFITNAIHN